MRTPYPALIAALLTTGPIAALAQAGGGPPGDPAAGRGLAERVCWACHVIPDWEPPAIEAPGAQPFEALAADPAVTGMALYAFLRSSHPTMPNFIFSDEELNDIIAYILSLKKERVEPADGTVTRSTITRRHHRRSPGHGRLSGRSASSRSSRVMRATASSRAGARAPAPAALHPRTGQRPSR